MTISMYQALIPVSIRTLNNLTNILEKGAAYAETKNIDPSVLINSRLSPDMFPLSKQVQIASDMNGTKKSSKLFSIIITGIYAIKQSRSNCDRKKAGRSPSLFFVSAVKWRQYLWGATRKSEILVK